MAHNEHFEELAALEALGIPLGDEASEFARHRGECDVCRTLVEELEASSTALAYGVPAVAPSPRVRRRILDEVSADAAAREGARRGSPVAPWLFAAAAALLALFFGYDDARLRRQREELRGQAAELSSRLQSAEQSAARRDLQVRVLESEDVRLLFLGGKGPQPDARARVFWSPKAKRSVLVAGNLAKLPPGKQYELWAFVGGKPVAAGVFDADAEGRALFESDALAAVTDAQNFAVTIEPQGGTTAPTGPIVLVGAP